MDLIELEKTLNINLKSLYSVSNKIASSYIDIKIPKKDGSFRLLSVPNKRLKYIQKRIACRLLNKESISEAAKAYVKGEGIISNAKKHIQKKMILKLDIAHFFDNIHFSLIKEKVFPLTKYSKEAQILLSILVYNIVKLPQGAPSSPMITNIIMKEFDEAVLGFCKELNITYTRYCDDMTFSGDSFDENEVILFVKTELKKLHLALNKRKTKVINSAHQQIVTGLVVNDKINVSRKYKKEVMKQIHIIENYGDRSSFLKTLNNQEKKSFLQSLLGKCNYIHSINKTKNYNENKEFLLYMINNV